MSDATETSEIRCVLLPIHSGQLLLPSVSITEVVGYQPPTPLKDASPPDWLLGTFKWRQRQIPLVSFDAMVSFPSTGVGHRARVAICNALVGEGKISHIAIMLSGIPRLIRITGDAVEPEGQIGDVGPMVLRQVRINGEEEAWIPNLDGLEEAIDGYFSR